MRRAAAQPAPTDGSDPYLPGHGDAAYDVEPGFIATAMTEALNDEQKARLNAQIPAGRMGEAAEIAAAAVYLASVEAAYVTGQTLHVNGGMAMI